jgi:hypothetical protein
MPKFCGCPGGQWSVVLLSGFQKTNRSQKLLVSGLMKTRKPSFIMEACPQQLFVLKALLNTFANSTGLKVNYSKSSMVPINLSSDSLRL